MWWRPGVMWRSTSALVKVHYKTIPGCLVCAASMHGLLTLLPCCCRPEGELRCVLAVIRHGDRTPKQKMKMKVTQEPLLALLHKYLDSKGKQAKLKVLDCFDT
jgi:hypothetical protein